MRKTIFMGSFPPPYGGVTVKNELLYDMLKDELPIVRKRRKFTKVDAVLAILFGHRFILSVGYTEFLVLLSSIMAVLRPKAMSRSVVMLVGGNLADVLGDDAKKIACMKRYRHIFVEPVGLLNRLRTMGFDNVSLFPNCRKRPSMEYGELREDGAMKCVFFSRICLQKGVDLILEAAKALDGILFDFYGPVEEPFQEDFLHAVDELPNVRYMGEFRGKDDELFRKLGEYDVMLLPTRALTEGVPGALVEAKFAGNACVVSNTAYNAEIITDGEQGIVLKENTAEAIIDALKKLDGDRTYLDELRKNNRRSAEDYCLDKYVVDLKNALGGGNYSTALRAVFFSRICPEKGVDIILGAVGGLEHVWVDFYGQADEGYEEDFLSKVKELPNVEFKGLFTERDEKLYSLLHGYDVILLPTYHEAEGIPGALVEAKIAGVPAIVSDFRYNAEIVEDGVSGIVLKENTTEALAEAIERLDKGRELLYQLKVGAKRSAEDYYIEKYIPAILEDLKE